MDDEVIAPGGTLLLHRQVGSSIGVVFVSDSAGDPGQTGIESQTEQRKQESEAASRLVGYEILRFLDHPDGRLSRREEQIGRELAIVLKEWRPELVFCPFPTDHHRDHQACAAAVALAIETAKWHGEVWGYEVWSTLWPNVAIDISGVVEQKRSAIAAHASQVKTMGYIEAALGLNRYRGLRPGVAYAEAFYVCKAVEYIALVRQLLFRV
jgi:LmbE family N-acetylglucosaminyl deacetylase